MEEDKSEERPAPGKPKRIFLTVAPFLALAVFKIWSSLGPAAEALLPAALVMLAFSVFVLIVASRWDSPSYFDWAVMAFFAGISGFLAIAPEAAASFLHRYPVTGIYAVLFAASFFPPLFGLDPFTSRYARKRAPKEFWDHPFFISINRIMTNVWSGIFFLCLLLSLYPSMITRVFIPLAIIMGIGWPFNVRFPSYYLKKKGIPDAGKYSKG